MEKVIEGAGTIQMLVWRCFGCGKKEELLVLPSQHIEYTDGVCEHCLWRLYPKYAAAILKEAREAGLPIR